MKGLVLSGGTGTRLRPLTHTNAKQLIPIANKPILFYVLEDIKNAGIDDVGIIVGHTKEEVMNAVGDGSKFGIKVTYIYQDAPLGLAHAVKISEDFLDNSPFVMYLGDNILKNGIQQHVKDFKEGNCDALISLCKVKHPERFGVAEMDGTRIIRLVEKPKNPKSDLALVGIYFFTNTIFEAVKRIKPSNRNELEITDAIQELINMNYKVEARLVEGWWKDTGKPEDVLEANQLVLGDLKPYDYSIKDEDVLIQGQVAIGKDTIIRKNTKIRGPVIIGESCEIGPDTYIGPYTSIGNNSKIIGGEIEFSIIIGDTYINCNKRIVESLIGKNSIIISSNKNIPPGCKLVLGDNSRIEI
ncbi:MAG: glucose-1-phosphate thymidylyltransferase [Candidatus Helarchaeota archaeon]